MDEVARNVQMLEKEPARSSATHANPLLVSVRCGAALSMPGMMDTVLNIGLNDEAVEGLAKATGNERFAYDSYRRLINMFGDIVMGVDHDHFEQSFRQSKDQVQGQERYRCAGRRPEGVVRRVQEGLPEARRQPFPQDPIKQLELAIEAVFKSWMQAIARSRYRAS